MKFLDNVFSSLNFEKEKIIAFQQFTASKKAESRRKILSSSMLQSKSKSFLLQIIKSEKKTWDAIHKLSTKLNSIISALPLIGVRLANLLSVIVEEKELLLVATESNLPQDINREKWELNQSTLNQNRLFTIQDEIAEILAIVVQLNLNLENLKAFLLKERANIIEPIATFDLNLEDFFTVHHLPTVAAVVLIDSNFVKDAVKINPDRLLDLHIPGQGIIPNEGIQELRRWGGGKNAGLVTSAVVNGMLSKDNIGHYSHVPFETVDETIRRRVMRLWRRTDDERKGITPEKFKGSADFQIIYYCFTHPNEDIVVLTSDGNLKRIIRWLGLEKVRFVSIYDGVLAAA